MQLKDKIYTIRDKQVMLDRDIAELYGVETRVLNQAVKRNNERFPDRFCFQLTEQELSDLRNSWISQNVIPNSKLMGLRIKPFVFTEHGVSMLASILKSKKAIGVSIKIIEEFISMRRFLNQNYPLLNKFQQIDQKLIGHDTKFDQIFKAIESKQIAPSQGIFYDGQIYDAYVFISKLIKSAEKEIILIDNYVDETTLTMLSQKNERVKVTIYTKNLSKQLALAKDKFNEQYAHLTIVKFDKAHDRFLIIDSQTYHIGASLKDAGKKWFAFSKLKDEIKILDQL